MLTKKDKVLILSLTILYIIGMFVLVTAAEHALTMFLISISSTAVYFFSLWVIVTKVDKEK